MAYKIFYSDDVEFEEQPGVTPPARGVQVILQDDDDNGPYFQSGSNFYIFRDGRWLGVDKFGLFDFLLDSGLVLFGRTITNKEYQAILKRAKVEKTTWKPEERKP